MNVLYVPQSCIDAIRKERQPPAPEPPSIRLRDEELQKTVSGLLQQVNFALRGDPLSGEPGSPEYHQSLEVLNERYEMVEELCYDLTGNHLERHC